MALRHSFRPKADGEASYERFKATGEAKLSIHSTAKLSLALHDEMANKSFGNFKATGLAKLSLGSVQSHSQFKTETKLAKPTTLSDFKLSQPSHLPTLVGTKFPNYLGNGKFPSSHSLEKLALAKTPEASEKESTSLDTVLQQTQIKSVQSPSFKDKSLRLLASLFLPATASAGESHFICRRPYYESASAAFDKVDGYANFSTMSTIIGGKVAENLDTGIFEHGCAIRISHGIFNASGLKEQVNCVIPRIKGETVSGGDGSQYIYRISTLIKFLKHVWGPPDYDSRERNSQAPKEIHGVVIHLMPEDAEYGYTGHGEVRTGNLPYGKFLYWHLPNKPILDKSDQPTSKLPRP